MVDVELVYEPQSEMLPATEKDSYVPAKPSSDWINLAHVTRRAGTLHLLDMEHTIHFVGDTSSRIATYPREIEEAAWLLMTMATLGVGRRRITANDLACVDEWRTGCVARGLRMQS